MERRFTVFSESGFSLNHRSERPVARSSPKWRLDSSGLLVNIANPLNALIRENGKWRSATAQEMKRIGYAY